jgi:hypothetical protein
MFSLASSIAFARLADAKQEFGPLRAMATFGWMAGCWLVSALGADASPLAGYTGATMWLLVAAVTFFVRTLEKVKLAGHVSWHERLGLDALTLLKNRDHRVVFITTALFCIPMCAFYPYAPVHLRALGFGHTSAWMTLGQVTEIISMVSLGALLVRWRLKWIFTCGLGFGVLRFGLSALNTKAGLLTGILLHGGSYTLVFITAQIYLDQRVDPAWRTRAQALMTLMNSGVGNLLGYLGTGWWFSACTNPLETRWMRFWGGLVVMVVLVLIHSLTSYRGQGAGFYRAEVTGECSERS